MSVRPELLAVLACPSPDHAPLTLETRDAREELVCTSCLSRFPISNGIPVLLADDAVPGPNGLGVAATSSPARNAPPDTAAESAQNGSA